MNNIIPGVTFNILDTTPSTAPVTLSLATDPTQISSALQDFVTNYNALKYCSSRANRNSAVELWLEIRLLISFSKTLELSLRSTYTHEWYGA